MSVLYCLLDGIGLTGEPAPPWSSARLHVLPELLGARPAVGLRIIQDTLLWKALDATMGVAGLPQSGSGHTALLTGVNAAALLGSHQAAFPGATLQRAIAEQSVLRRVREHGLRPYQATAYPERYWALVAERRVRPAAGALAARAAGLELPSTAEWLAGKALPWDITGEHLRERRAELARMPALTAQEAGGRLAALAREHDLVFYECYLPDFVGHRRIAIPHEHVLELVDALLGSLLAAMRPGDTLVAVSDHGNLEEPEHRRHTRNLVPLLVSGPGAPLFAAVTGIEEVPAAVLRVLGLPGPGPRA